MFVSLTVLTVCALVVGVSLGVTFLVLRRLYRHLDSALAAARLDPLIGVLGRNGLLERIAVLTRRGRAPGVLLLDLLRFKDVNDRWGHDAGDDLLVAVAKRLTAVAAGFGAEVGRLGGDEYVVLLPGDPSDAMLVELCEQILQAMDEPVPLVTGAVTVQIGLAIGAASATAKPLPGRPFRAADIALYHARHHRQPFAVYRPGMVHPTREQRHGDRLRDLHPAPLAAVFDAEMFARLVAGEVSGDRAHPDAIAELGELLEVLDPRGRDFGTDVLELVARCVDHEVLRLSGLIESIQVEPTVLGQARDGGFRVLITLDSGPVLATPQLHPRAFTGHPDPATVAIAVMKAVADAVNAAWDSYRAASAGVVR